METNYKNKFVINILMTSITLLLIVIFVFNLNIPCLFKSVFHINCPACGLTRSFRAILKLNLIDAIKYNLLGIPLFIGIIIMYVLYFIDLIYKTNFLTKLYTKFTNNYILIIIGLIGMFIINN